MSGPKYEIGEAVPPSQRHPSRAKGTPFSRVRVTRVEPSSPGRPAIVHYRHHTRGTGRGVPMYPLNLRLFASGMTFAQATELTGGYGGRSVEA